IGNAEKSMNLSKKKSEIVTLKDICNGKYGNGTSALRKGAQTHQATCRILQAPGRVPFDKHIFDSSKVAPTGRRRAILEIRHVFGGFFLGHRTRISRFWSLFFASVFWQ